MISAGSLGPSTEELWALETEWLTGDDHTVMVGLPILSAPHS